MKAPLLPGQRQDERLRCSPSPGTWWRALLLAAIVALSLACVTSEMTLKVVRQEDQEERVSVTLSRHMTDEYLEAARRANADREADYRAAGRDLTDDGFFDSMEQAGELLLVDREDLISDGFQIVEDDRGFTASADYTLAEFLEKQTPDSTTRLQVDRGRPEGVLYIVEIALPEVSGDLEEFDQLRQAWPLPKPPLEPIDEEQLEDGSVSQGLTALLDMAGLGTTELDLWYAQRVLIETGIPQNTYSVELPGQIVLHEVSGVPYGQVEGNRVTLVFDEAFLRQFGPGEHRFRVESLLSVCQETCAEQAHLIWDGVSEYPQCTCICEKGWEATAEGCVDCPSLCAQQDPPTEYDPENSENNRCACRPLPDRDGDGVPDDQDKCPEEAAQTEDGCPEGGGAAPATPDEGTTPSTSDTEKFVTGGRTRGPSAGQAAGAAATLAGLAYLWWVLYGSDAVDTRLAEIEEELADRFPPPPPPPAEKPSPLLPNASPQSLQLLQTKFQEMVDQRIKEGYYVKNRDWIRKSWNWTIGRVTDWAQGYTGGQCGEFAEWGAEWSEDFVREVFGPGAIVDHVYVGEISTRYPDGFIAAADHLVYEANHAATRVILPTGESYILDYWVAVGGGEVRLIPEKEWIEKWTEAIGKDDSEVFNTHPAQETFRKFVSQCDTFEEACERFRNYRPMLRGVSDEQVQTIINNWRKSP